MPECICDDLAWDEYCEACDGPYDEWKQRIEAEKQKLRKG